MFKTGGLISTMGRADRLCVHVQGSAQTPGLRSGLLNLAPAFSVPIKSAGVKLRRALSPDWKNMLDMRSTSVVWVSIAHTHSHSEFRACSQAQGRREYSGVNKIVIRATRQISKP